MGGELTSQGAPPVLTPLPRDFFGRPAVQAAPDLLGCVLRHDSPDGPVAVQITEVEAYAGAADPASHAYRGQTARNAVMFGDPGHAYVYFTYGLHYCVNLVCLPAGTAEAVLLRAGRVTEGADLAAARRTARRSRPARPPVPRDLARGPARLCQALGIDRDLDGADVCQPGSALVVTGPAGAAGGISQGPRIGISRATELPWRFWVTGDPAVTPFRPYQPRRRN